MSIWDILDHASGGSGVAYKPPRLQGSGIGGYVGSTGGTSGAPATSSQQRTAPERLDVNDFVSGINFGEQRQQTLGDQAAAGGTQLLEAAGKAPGFALERPLAVVDTIAQNATGKSPIAGLEGAIGQIPGIGALLGGAGDALQNLSSLPAAIANSGLANSLKQGTVEGWADDQLVQEGIALPSLGIGPLQIGGNNAAPETWAQFKQSAYAKGWKDADIQDLVDGKKSSFDFGDKRMSADNLTEMALRIGSDPTNLLFGAGAALKLGRGVGLLASSVARGAELAKPLAPALAAEGLMKGIASESTWMGIAEHFGQLGRGLGSAGLSSAVSATAKAAGYGGKLGKAYRNISIGTTAAQLGIGAVDAVTHIGDNANTPHSGFMEPLFDLNRKAFDNQPFSNNTAFSLWSAFHFPIREYIGDVKAKMNAGKTAALGNGTYEAMVSALREGWDGTEADVLERAGGSSRSLTTPAAQAEAAVMRSPGEGAIWNMIGHTHARIALEKIAANPKVQAAIKSYRSLDEAVLANNTLAGWVGDRLDEMYRKGEITPKQTVATFKDWFANRAEGGHTLNAVEFPWHGGDAIDKWHEFDAATAPVNDVYRQRGDVVIGLRDQLIDLDIEHMGAVLKTTQVGDKLPLAEIRKWLSKFPQLVNEDPGWNKYLIRGADEWQDAGPVIGKIKRAQKAASTARELTNEAGTAETAAAREAVANPVDEQDLAQRAVNGGATVGTSRMKPAMARKLGLAPADLGAVQRARLDPHIATFDESLPEVWKKQGLNYNDMTQTAVSDVQGLAPGVEINTDARLPEMRQQAAILGELGGHEQTRLAVYGERMRELGLRPNGWKAIMQLPSTDSALMSKAVDAANREFGGAFDFNDTTGTLSIYSTERPDTAALARLSTELEGYFPKDRIGDTGMRTGLHRSYTETLTKKKGPDGSTYASILRDAKPRGTSLAAYKSQLAYRRPDGGHGVAGLGLQPELGRDAGAGVGRPGDQPVGSGAGVGDPALAPREDGYHYHTADESTAAAAAEEGLHPGAPAGLSWADGGTGKRTYLNADDGKPVLMRVKDTRAGTVKNDAQATPYTRSKIGGQHLEVWGADGQWHPARGFFQSEVEPHIQALADTAAPAYTAAESVPDPLTLGLRAQEDAASPGAIDESAALSQVAQTGDATAIEAQRLATDHTARGRVLDNAKLDADASQFLPISHMFDNDPAVQRAELQALDNNLQTHNPQYQVKRAPEANVFRDVTTGSAGMAQEYLKRRTAIGDALATWGPTSRISRFYDALTSPLTNKSLGMAAKQEAYAAFVEHKATPAQVDEFMQALHAEAAKHTIGPTHFRFFRNPLAMDAQLINKVARGDVESKLHPIFSKETISSVGHDNFSRVLDRASNRFIRAADAAARKGGRKGSLGRALGDGYGAWQHSVAGDSTRLVSKTFYHIFRFTLDPRYWAMNMLEQDILGATGYGLSATRLEGAHKAPLGPAYLSHQQGGGAAVKQAISDLEPDTGWMYTRRNGGFGSKMFDAARPQDTISVIRGIQQNDPAFQSLVKMVGESPGADVIKMLDDDLYAWDTKGPTAHGQDEFQTLTTDAAKAGNLAAQQEADKMMPLFQKMFERHEQSYKDIVQSLNGNPDRSTLERIANSYWLFWPISYQIKAGKALWQALSHRFAGAETNLAGAALYAHYFEEHKKAMATDPSYVQMFKDHPTLWFMAQMMLPITPGDMGVSLSRIPRYAGGELGLWGKYAAAKDPFSAAAAVLTLGPAYTATLVARAGKEIFGRSTSAPAPTAPFFGNQ